MCAPIRSSFDHWVAPRIRIRIGSRSVNANGGVFRALYRHVEALAKERQDVCGLRLYVDAHNARARLAYEKLGLKRTDYELFEIDFVLQHS